VAVLLLALVSVTPNGTATAAVLVSVPVAPAAIAAVTENVTEAPTGRLTVLLIEPLPDAGHVPPPEPEHVHVMELTPAGVVSVTDAPVTLDGPVLDTTTV
jgi:proline racemase